MAGWCFMAAEAGLIGYQTSTLWRGERIVTLVDIVKPGLRVLFFGCNPAPKSVELGHYHQGNFGRQFWGYLRRFGFVPSAAMHGREDEYLRSSRIGISDIVKRKGPRCSEVDPKEYSYGRPLLTSLIRENQPIRVVCSVYKSAMEQLLDEQISMWGPIGKRLGVESEFFVLPFPPGKGSNRSVIDRAFQRLYDMAFAQGWPNDR